MGLNREELCMDYLDAMNDHAETASTPVSRLSAHYLHYHVQSSQFPFFPLLPVLSFWSVLGSSGSQDRSNREQHYHFTISFRSINRRRVSLFFYRDAQLIDLLRNGLCDTARLRRPAGHLRHH